MTYGILRGLTIGGIIGGITSVIIPVVVWWFPDDSYNLSRFYYVLIVVLVLVIFFIAGFVGGGIVGAIFGKIIKEDKEYFDKCLVAAGFVGGIIGYGIIHILAAVSAVLVRNLS